MKMCLSTVYKMTGDQPVFFCKNIQNVETDASGKLTFTDIMGMRYTANGRIQSIDLINNTIHIKEAQP